MGIKSILWIFAILIGVYGVMGPIKRIMSIVFQNAQVTVRTVITRQTL